MKKVVYVGGSPEYVKALTSQWEGERLQDGRPKVSDALLERLEKLSLEEVWDYLMKKGYLNQVEVSWKILKPGKTMVGRVLTAQYMPGRPDLDSMVKAAGKEEGRSQSGGINIWPIDMLTQGDIYVADGYLKVRNGTLIGGNLGASIYRKTGKGVIFYGAIRDMHDLREIEGFNAWIQGHDPSFIKQMTLTGINVPVRIGEVTVFPGDVAYASDYGVAFIPSHLLEGLVSTAEIVGIMDEFQVAMMQTGKYLTGEIHGKWSDKIINEFKAWFAKYPEETSVTLEQIEAHLKTDYYDDVL